MTKDGGQCRAEPPKIMQTAVPVRGSSISLQGSQMQPGLAAVWPPMNENEWCRYWKARDGRE